ncbi:hypothetical protein NQ315_007863 [Exocentrus adspersus]|uniref:ATP-dependent (S)-NAD(P)H-hydrate dehydratase n=1 Tax=Exocentrus adspersus TaxID=1586481 RepID=A0AAV8W8P0_9CUCU|nr:hypothetical protein NQ315_007863 [Exocentrus adspersus]
MLLSLTSKSLIKVNRTRVCTISAFSKSFFRAFGSNMSQSLENQIAEKTKQLAPPLTNDRHKGQAGRIGVFGGSLEFTGAPYYSAITSLKVGADLVYVFCAKEAGLVIKSYSPELIVLPILDQPNAVQQIEPWLKRLHVVLIGPGLGRLPSTFAVIERIIGVCRNKKLPLVIDADGLIFVSQKPDVIKDYPAPIVLTPNVMEFGRLVGQNTGDGTKLERSSCFLNKLGGQVTILCKDHEDEIISNGKSVKVSGGGSGRRSGGQGDMLGGSLSTFLHWALEKQVEPNIACFAACRLTRDCNARAFAKQGRSMTAVDMIHEIHDVFEENFELK